MTRADEDFNSFMQTLAHAGVQPERITAMRATRRTRQAELDKAAAKYRRTYDRLFVASQKAGSAAECEAIDAKLAKANAEYAAAKAKFGEEAA